MSNKLKKHINKYARVPNGLLNDKNVSLKAKGLFALIESKPEDWDFSARGLASQAKESVDAISSGLKELEDIGFLKRERYQDKQGHWQVNYHLYDESPRQESPRLENPRQEDPDTGKSPNIQRKTNKERLTNNTNTNNDTLLKELLNKVTGRNFRVLPNGYKKTLKEFTLEEIEKALLTMKKDKWHSERWGSLKSDYLIRSSTIDNFLNKKSSGYNQSVSAEDLYGDGSWMK